MANNFELIHSDSKTKARTAKLTTSHGVINTPCFMPVGTQATVKTLSPNELEEIGIEIVLCNTYHLHLRPGIDIIKENGGLHKFMGWNHPILTDSGGYQVFSLAKLMKVKKEGVHFQSHIDGSKRFLSPEDAVKLQLGFRSDIIMPLDECVHYPVARERARDAMETTLDWAERSKKEFSIATENRAPRTEHLLFGIVQGATYNDLRKECAERLIDIGFDGYAAGGVSVGEPEELLDETASYSAGLLPTDKPRYLMGVGGPFNILNAVEAGFDMFDCVVPTRNGRNGQAFTWAGKLNVSNAAFAHDLSPVEKGCGCYACRNFSRSYIRHLFNTDEILGLRLVSLHNLYFYASFMREIREAISEGRFVEFKEDFKRRHIK